MLVYITQGLDIEVGVNFVASVPSLKQIASRKTWECVRILAHIHGCSFKRSLKHKLLTKAGSTSAQYNVGPVHFVGLMLFAVSLENSKFIVLNNIFAIHKFVIVFMDL